MPRRGPCARRCNRSEVGQPTTRLILLRMSDIGDTVFHRGQPVWVIEPDGSQRAAEYVGEGETSAWFGGPPTVIVIFPDTQTGQAVEVDRVIAREE